MYFFSFIDMFTLSKDIFLLQEKNQFTKPFSSQTQFYLKFLLSYKLQVTFQQ